jgi:hypothetical protein
MYQDFKQSFGEYLKLCDEEKAFGYLANCVLISFIKNRKSYIKTHGQKAFTEKILSLLRNDHDNLEYRNDAKSEVPVRKTTQMLIRKNRKAKKSENYEVNAGRAFIGFFSPAMRLVYLEYKLAELGESLQNIAYKEERIQIRIKKNKLRIEFLLLRKYKELLGSNFYENFEITTYFELPTNKTPLTFYEVRPRLPYYIIDPLQITFELLSNKPEFFNIRFGFCEVCNGVFKMGELIHLIGVKEMGYLYVPRRLGKQRTFSFILQQLTNSSSLVLCKLPDCPEIFLPTEKPSKVKTGDELVFLWLNKAMGRIEIVFRRSNLDRMIGLMVIGKNDIREILVDLHNQLQIGFNCVKS